MALPRVEGDLGFKEFRCHPDALLCQWFTRALDDHFLGWARLVTTNLQLIGWKKSKLLRHNKYSFIDKTVCSPGSWGGLSYTGGLWKAWVWLKAFLSFVPGVAGFPGSWCMEDVLRCTRGFHSLPNECICDITIYL